eukprot:SAG31_NODE_6185_length_2132_cov_2.190851_1_plen_48_part_00
MGNGFKINLLLNAVLSCFGIRILALRGVNILNLHVQGRAWKVERERG